MKFISDDPTFNNVRDRHNKVNYVNDTTDLVDWNNYKTIMIPNVCANHDSVSCLQNTTNRFIEGKLLKDSNKEMNIAIINPEKNDFDIYTLSKEKHYVDDDGFLHTISNKNNQRFWIL